MTWLFAIGSPFGNDNIAWLLADALKRNHPDVASNFNILYLDRPGIQLVNELEGKDSVILLDALSGENLSGDIIEIDWRDLYQHSAQVSSHDFAVAQALHLAAQLNTLPLRLRVLGIDVDINTTTQPALVNELVHPLAARLATAHPV